MKNIKINNADVSKIIIIFGIWMRGRGLAGSPLWYDEAFSINMARLPIYNMIRATWLDYSPGLHYLIIKPFAWINTAPWLARIPSLLASIMALAVIWEMMDDWKVTENQRLWISALTLLPGFYWLAQDARVYAIMGLLYLVSFWLMMGGQYGWGSVIMGLMIWGHTTGIILVASIIIVQLVRDWLLQGMMDIREDIYKQTAKKNLLAGLVAFIIGIPALIPTLLSPTSGEFIRYPLTGPALANSVEAAMFVETNQGWPGLLTMWVVWLYIILALVITWVAWADWKLILRANIKTGLSIKDDIVITNFLLVAIPIIMMLVVSILIKPIIFYRPLMILLWPFIIWIGSATAMGKYKPHKLIMPILLALGLIYTQANWSPRLKGSNLDYYADIINNQPGDILYATGTTALPFDLYIDRPGWVAADNHHPNLGSPEMMFIFGLHLREPGCWVDWLIWPRDPLISNELDYKLKILTTNMELVGVVEYWQMADVEIWRAIK